MRDVYRLALSDVERRNREYADALRAGRKGFTQVGLNAIQAEHARVLREIRYLRACEGDAAVLRSM